MSTFDKLTKRNQFFEARDSELDALIDQKTGRVHKKLVEAISCRLCNWKKYTEVFTKNGFSFVRCNRCSLVYVNPQMKEDAVVRFYNEDAVSNKKALDFLSSGKQQEVDKELYDDVFGAIKSCIPRGKILDVGCSFGLFLHEAKKRGYEVQGLELNERAAKVAREKMGVPVEAKLLNECKFPKESFDVVAMFGVIEHLPRPVPVIREVFRILRPGGIFLGRCPNIMGLVCMILHEQARTVTGRAHVSYFSEKTLTYLLKDKVGFSKVELQTFVSGKDSLLNYFQFLDPFGNETTEFLPSAFQAFLRDGAKVKRLERTINELGLGYKFKFIATK
ncbi:MAG: class I SAM-dependent methyltransferase [Candidatus Vogelbacteria bacterium]|nr:class I SAM-dependent methyltransferase [Candidatus Vogelbacteria bacterium]